LCLITVPAKRKTKSLGGGYGHHHPDYMRVAGESDHDAFTLCFALRHHASPPVRVHPSPGHDAGVCAYCIRAMGLSAAGETAKIKPELDAALALEPAAAQRIGRIEAYAGIGDQALAAVQLLYRQPTQVRGEATYTDLELNANGDINRPVPNASFRGRYWILGGTVFQPRTRGKQNRVLAFCCRAHLLRLLMAEVGTADVVPATDHVCCRA
jgi:hypothetical protein